MSSPSILAPLARLRPLVLAVLVVAPVALLVVAACKSASGTVSSTGTVGSVSWNANVGVNQPAPDPVEYENTSSDCWEIRYYDAQGQTVGAITIGPGVSHGAVPQGATSWTAVKVPCPPAGGGSSGGGGGTMFEDGTALASAADGTHAGHRARTRPVPLQIEVLGAPFWFDRDAIHHNAQYRLLLRVTSADEAFALARQTIAAAAEAPIDARVTVLSLCRAYEGLLSVSVVAIAQQPFDLFEMDVNGALDYAVLGAGADQSQLPAGQWRVEAAVPYADIYGYNAWNVLAIRMHHGALAGGAPEDLSVAMMHTN